MNRTIQPTGPVPTADPNYTRQHIALANEAISWIDGVSSPDDAAEIPRTAQYRVVNALLELAITQIREDVIPELEEWEFHALVNSFEKTKFRDLDPDRFFISIDFNRELAQKIGGFPRLVRLKLLLKILAERKPSLLT